MELDCPTDVSSVGNADFPLGKWDKGRDFPFLPPNLQVWSMRLPLLPQLSFPSLFPETVGNHVFHYAGYCQSFLSGADESVGMPHGGLAFCQRWALLTIHLLPRNCAHPGCFILLFLISGVLCVCLTGLGFIF